MYEIDQIKKKSIWFQHFHSYSYNSVNHQIYIISTSVKNLKCNKFKTQIVVNPKTPKKKKGIRNTLKISKIILKLKFVKYCKINKRIHQPNCDNNIPTLH